ncbi:hypothetical protein Esti_003359 [Eimeria stiedai]
MLVLPLFLLSPLQGSGRNARGAAALPPVPSSSDSSSSIASFSTTLASRANRKIPPPPGDESPREPHLQPPVALTMPASLPLRLLLPAAAAAAAALGSPLPLPAAADAPLEPVASEVFSSANGSLVSSDEEVGGERAPSPVALPDAEASLPLGEAAAAAAAAEELADLEDAVPGQQQQPYEKGVQGAAPGVEGVARKLVASAQHMMDRIYSVARGQRGQPKGTRTALLGALGMLLFLGLHMLVQYVNEAPLDKELLFNSATGRATASGTGLIVSATLFVAGALEALAAYVAPKNAVAPPSMFPARGRKQASIGRLMILATAVAITLGWVLGFPMLFMEVATTGFLVGSTLVILGFTFLLREFQRGVEMMRQLYAPHAGDVKALSEEARLDAKLIIQLADHFITRGLPEPVPVDQLMSSTEEAQQQLDDGDAPAAPARRAEELLSSLAQHPHRQRKRRSVEDAVARGLIPVLEELERNPQLVEQLQAFGRDLGHQLLEGDLESAFAAPADAAPAAPADAAPADADAADAAPADAAPADAAPADAALADAASADAASADAASADAASADAASADAASADAVSPSVAPEGAAEAAADNEADE